MRFLHCEEAAADAVQEVWVRLIRLKPRGTVDNPRAYLYQVAANVARDRIRENQRRGRIITQDTGVVEVTKSPEPDPEASAMATQRLGLLSAAVDELPPRCREVFLMSRIDGLANSEIAQRLGITRNAVEKNIIRAMLHCRGCLKAADQ